MKTITRFWTTILVSLLFLSHWAGPVQATPPSGTIHVRDEQGTSLRSWPDSEEFVTEFLGPVLVCCNIDGLFCDDRCDLSTGIITTYCRSIPAEVTGASSSGSISNLDTTSILDNLTFNHIHIAADYRLGGGSGCGSCGGGGTSNVLPGLQLGRRHRFRNMTEGSSFGPGVFLNYDIRLTLSASGSTNKIQLFDPNDLYGRELTDGGSEGAKDGVFHDIDTEASKELRLYDELDQPATNIQQSVRAELINKGGEVLHFEVFDSASPEPAWLEDIHRGNVVRMAGNHFFKATGYTGVTGAAARTSAGWIRTTSKGSVMYWGKNLGGQRWGMRVQTENGTKGAIRIEVHGGYIVGSTDLRDGVWHHVAAVLPAGATNVNQILLYVDGQLETVSASLAKVINTSGVALR